QALDQYEGTFIVVSHDRYLLDNVANKIWFIEDQQIKEYPGTYAEYEDWQSKRQAQSAKENREQAKNNKPKEEKKSESSPKSEPNARQEQQAKQKRIDSLNRKLSDVEKQVSESEQ